MIDSISVSSDNLVINKGGGGTPPPPPSSPEINNSQSGQPAAVVELSKPVAQDSAKKSERVEKSQSEEKPPEEELKDSIDSLNKKLGKINQQILFKLDKKIDKHYISVIDKDSKEIIREFPPEEIRNFIARFDEFNEKLSTSSDVKSLIINLEV